MFWDPDTIDIQSSPANKTLNFGNMGLLGWWKWVSEVHMQVLSQKVGFLQMEILLKVLYKWDENPKQASKHMTSKYNEFQIIK